MEKKITFLGLVSLILIIGLLAIGCEGRNSPSRVVRQLHTAVQRGDTARISELMVPEAAGLALKMLSDFQAEYADSGGISRMDETITGNTATVRVTYRNGLVEVIDLVRRDGRWLVTITK